MDNTIKLSYEEIYTETAELEQFVQSDIIEQSKKDYSEIDGLISEMSGRTNNEYLNTSLSNQEKIYNVSKVLLSIINFINTSTKELELEDIRISKEIEIKEVSDES